MSLKKLQIQFVARVFDEIGKVYDGDKELTVKLISLMKYKGGWDAVKAL